MSNSLVLFERKDFNVFTNQEALEAREEAIAVASLCQAVRDDKSRDVAIEAQNGLKYLTAAAERERANIKRPVIDLGKKIDATAAEYAEPIQAAYKRLDDMVCEYESEKRELARKIEEKRLADIAAEEKRIRDEQLAAERERIRLEQEKQRAIDEANAKAARARNEETRKKAQAESDRLKAEQESQRKRDEEARAAEQAKAVEQIEQKRAEMGPPVNVTTAQGQSVSEPWDFRVVDIHKLYLNRGQQCVKIEEKRAAILALINAGGVRDIPGLEIFQLTKNRVNVQQGRKAIDV